MMVSYLLLVPAALPPGKESSVCTRYKAGWDLEPTFIVLENRKRNPRI
jgi:hypothetical protein